MVNLIADRRGYPTVGAAEGYGEWAAHYDDTVAEGLDRPLLERLKTIEWGGIARAADLACGTGRTGAWLKGAGVGSVDGIDITPSMLERARLRGAHDTLQLGDVAATPLADAAYDLVTLVLADEHLAQLGPVYREAARLLAGGGAFLLIGYHPFFLLNGYTTHFHRPGGEAVTIETYLHLFGEHFAQGRESGLALVDVEECVIDEDWLLAKPKWRPFLGWPASFALVWRRS